MSPIVRLNRKRKLLGGVTFTSSKFACRAPTWEVGTDHDIDMNLLRLSIDDPATGAELPAHGCKGGVVPFGPCFDKFLERQSQVKLVDNALQLSRLREQKHFVKANECMDVIRSLSENDGGSDRAVPRSVLNAVLEVYCGKPVQESGGDGEADVGTHEDPCHPGCETRVGESEIICRTSQQLRERSRSCPPLKFKCAPEVVQSPSTILQDPNQDIVKNLQQLKREINYVKFLRDPCLQGVLLDGRKQRAVKQASGITSRVPQHDRKRFQLVILHGKRFQLRRCALSDYNEISSGGKVRKPFEDREILRAMDQRGRTSPPMSTHQTRLPAIAE
jgi:hypothetical protein